MSKLLRIAGMLTMLMSLAWQVEAAELSLVCPCKAERVGQTAVRITAGVINTGETDSGELRIVLGSASSLPISAFYIQAYRYFPETLKSGESYQAGTEATVAFQLPRETSLDSLDRTHLILVLQEKVDGEWSARDRVRLGSPVTFPDPLVGGESPQHKLFLEGKPSLEIEGSEATLRIPKVVNSSLEAVTISRVVIGHFRSAEFWGQSAYLGLKEDDLSITVEALSSLTNVEIKGDYSGPSKSEPFTHLRLESEDGYEVWETIEAREGNVISTYPFTANSIDLLVDSDDDGVSDFNEDLFNTDPTDATSQPETVVIDVMALYTPAVAREYNGEPETMILQELEWGNQALRNNNINVGFRLVKTQSTNYEGLDIEVALDAMVDQSGVFEGIDAVREEVGADLLALYIEKDPDSDLCGLATTSGAWASGAASDGDLAFSRRSLIATVVAKGAAGCRTSNLTHEFGHNLGLGHSVRQESNTGTFTWSRGHGVDGLFTTIMAYSSAYDYFGPEIQYFSNPDFSCNGQPCGVDKSDLSLGADAALSIRTTMYQIAELTAEAGNLGDDDGDGITNDIDAFPNDPMETKDSDGDDVGDNADAFPNDSSETVDTDGDGIGDNGDNCASVANTSQTNTDNDGLGNACDTDDDDDGVLDRWDAFPLDASEQRDTDGDGVGNNADFYPNDATASVYDVCRDVSVSAKLASASTLPIEKRLVFANPASNKNQQTFVRFVNPSAEAVDVELYGTDDSGIASKKTPISFTLAAGESKQMTAQDLENGNTNKGLASAMCDGAGKWQITARSSKAIQIMGLIRTPDGFLTGLTDVVPIESGSNIVYFANAASNSQQQTFLRVVNNSSSAGTVTITAIDNLGVTGSESVSFELAANGSKQMTAQDLENGNEAKGLTGKLGDGTGKWRLTIASSLDLSAQSLIRTPDGFLTNLSALVTPNASGTSTLSFFNPASNTAQQSFVRIVNSGTESSSVTISGVDDAGQIAPSGDVSLTLTAGQSTELSAADLEQGNTGLQLTGLLGVGSGRWRLEVSSDPQISVMSYVLASTGFLTNMSEVVGAASTTNTVWIFNPGSNSNQASKLRVINSGSSTAAVTISGIDDAGNASPGTNLTFNLSGGSVKEITAAELENGSSEKGLAGGIGDGKGKWRLTVTSDEPVTVQSLLETPAGFITNLSTSAQ